MSSRPPIAKSLRSRFCANVFQFIFPCGICYFPSFFHISFFFTIFVSLIYLQKPFAGTHMRILWASTLWAHNMGHIVPSRPSGKPRHVTQKRNLFRAPPAPFWERANSQVFVALTGGRNTIAPLFIWPPPAPKQTGRFIHTGLFTENWRRKKLTRIWKLQRQRPEF